MIFINFITIQNPNLDNTPGKGSSKSLPVCQEIIFQNNARQLIKTDAKKIVPIVKPSPILDPLISFFESIFVPQDKICHVFTTAEVYQQIKQHSHPILDFLPVQLAGVSTLWKRIFDEKRVILLGQILKNEKPGAFEQLVQEAFQCKDSSTTPFYLLSLLFFRIMGRKMRPEPCFWRSEIRIANQKVQQIKDLLLTSLYQQVTRKTVCAEKARQFFENPKNRKQWEKVQKIEWKQRNVPFLPEQLFLCTNLRELTIDSSKMVFISPRIQELSQLTSLYITGNSLLSFPDEIGRLSSLRYLDLSNNSPASKKIPNNFENLTNLKLLNLSRNGISCLPNGMGNWKQLIDLSLHSNEIQGIPETIAELHNLIHLYLHDNLLTGLPSSMKSMRLISLSLEKNEFDHRHPVFIPSGCRPEDLQTTEPTSHTL